MLFRFGCAGRAGSWLNVGGDGSWRSCSSNGLAFRKGERLRRVGEHTVAEADSAVTGPSGGALMKPQPLQHVGAGLVEVQRTEICGWSGYPGEDCWYACSKRRLPQQHKDM